VVWGNITDPSGQMDGYPSNVNWYFLWYWLIRFNNEDLSPTLGDEQIQLDCQWLSWNYSSLGIDMDRLNTRNILKRKKAKA
jgi:hypothetical protein